MGTSTKPSVSVAMCSYNGAEYIKEQIASILDQTFQNLELVIVDDCSKDNTVSIIKEIAEHDARVKVHCNESNLGFNKNFEKAISLCEGEYIAISDQDDIWVNNKLERVMAEWKPETVLMHHSTKTFSGHPLPSLMITNEYDRSRCTSIRHILTGNFVQGCTTIFKADLREVVMPFNPNLLYDWWIGVCAFNTGHVQYLHENLIYHRRHDTSAHYSKKRTRFELHKELYDNLSLILKSGVLKETDAAFVKEVLSMYQTLMNSRYSLKVALWFFKHRELTLWNCFNKPKPLVSCLTRSIKAGKGSVHRQPKH